MDFDRRSIVRPSRLGFVDIRATRRLRDETREWPSFFRTLLSGTDHGLAQPAAADKASLDEVIHLARPKQRDSLIVETMLAPIRSRADLDQYLKAHPESPFDAFSRRAFERFVDSLTFNDIGLTGYRTAEIESDLTPRQAYAILSLFGVQKTISSLEFEHADDEVKTLLQ